ncbi:MAG: MBL fold metallo-hydrolase [Chloroflexi bacterium]|nr:MBL fold metallo-hydrolase [Chloroflexota bacterium]
MRRERVADDIYVFTSELYAQVTAGAIITPAGAILIDALVFPEEAKSIRHFIENRLNTTVRYIINTHYHADHTFGTCFFENAVVISHAMCHELLLTKGQESLLQAQQQNPRIFSEVTIRLPQLTFESGMMELRLGGKTLQMSHSPGHSMDSIVVQIKEDRVLFAGDTLMPIPYFVDGDFDIFIESLKALRNGGYENVIQGHGEVILRGEVERKIESDLEYMDCIYKQVKMAMTRSDPVAYLRALDVEQCGKSRIPLNGGVQELHIGNLMALLEQFTRREDALKQANSVG